MSGVALALSLLLGDDLRGWAVKARARVQGANFYHATFTKETVGEPGVLQGSVDLKQPFQQRVAVERGKQKMELLQSSDSMVALDHEGRRYREYFPAPFLLPPPPHGILDGCLPPPLFWDNPQFAQVSRWKIESAATPATLSADIEVIGGVLHFVVQVDADFVMRSCVMWSLGAESEKTTWKLTEDSTADRGQGQIVDALPEGYVPDVLTKAPGLISPGRPLGVSTVPDARGGKPLNLWASGKPGVIVFTSPDCEPSQAIEEALRELRPKVEAAGASFVEVSTWGNPPDLAKKEPGRAVGHDVSGDIGRALRFEMTPYVIVCDGNGVMLRGFAGYAPDQKKVLVQTVLDALKPPSAQDD